MASYRAIPGVLSAVKRLLENRISQDSDISGFNPEVVILGNRELTDKPSKNQIGIYLHRVSVDPIGRNRYITGNDLSQRAQPELPVNLHVLLIAWTHLGANEGLLIGWAMQHIGSALTLDISHMAVSDESWLSQEQVQMIPEEMSTENLLRIWDALPQDYLLSVPYLIKTLRVLPIAQPPSEVLVDTVITPIGTL
jgi:hypothetical protein